MTRAIGIETIEKKIENLQTEVVKAKKKYDTVVAKLSDLMDRRDAIKRDELVKLIMKSNKSYEEILYFLKNDIVEE